MDREFADGCFTTTSSGLRQSSLRPPWGQNGIRLPSSAIIISTSCAPTAYIQPQRSPNAASGRQHTAPLLCAERTSFHPSPTFTTAVLSVTRGTPLFCRRIRTRFGRRPESSHVPLMWTTATSARRTLSKQKRGTSGSSAIPCGPGGLIGSIPYEFISGLAECRHSSGKGRLLTISHRLAFSSAVRPSPTRRESYPSPQIHFWRVDASRASIAQPVRDGRQLRSAPRSTEYSTRRRTFPGARLLRRENLQ